MALNNTEFGFKINSNKAVRAHIRKENAAEAVSDPPLKMEFDDRIYSDNDNWQIREALVFSFNWGYASMTAEEFINSKRDCYITDLLSCSATSLEIKITEAKIYLGQSSFILLIKTLRFCMTYYKPETVCFYKTLTFL